MAVLELKKTKVRKIEEGAAKMFLHNIKLKHICHRFYFQLFEVYVGNLKYFSLKMSVLADASRKWPPSCSNNVYIHEFSPRDRFIHVLHVDFGLAAKFGEFIVF